MTMRPKNSGTNFTHCTSRVRNREKQKGLTTVEYAVAGALVAATLVTAFTELGDQVGVVITGLTSALGG